jgi:hypothetical protein
VFFYELHEGDEDIFTDVLLMHEAEIPPDEFFEMVQSVRRRVQDTYEDDTLIEAIANELEREEGFVFVSDDRLTAAVNVSTAESENFLVQVEAEEDDDEEDEADDDEDEVAGDYRSILADFEPGDGSGRPN